MRITFERHGGFAGMRLAAEIDASTLEPSEAARLRQLVAAAGFFDLPSKVAGPGTGADQFQYSVTVAEEGRRHTVQVVGIAGTPALQELLHYLTELAWKKRRAQ